MSRGVSRPRPSLDVLLKQALEGETRPAAFVLAGHNGSGKSTLWYERLAGKLQLPRINADRLMISILPDSHPLPVWAQALRDDDVRWQTLSQEAVRAFKALVMERRMPFAFETVFSHWQPVPGGGHASKAQDIQAMQAAGYFVVLLFVGLASPDLSVFRVSTRKKQGGHDVPFDKLIDRFPRTQAAVGHAAPLADMTLMFDNSRGFAHAFSLVRAQRQHTVLFDARDPQYKTDPDLRTVAQLWLDRVSGPWAAPPVPAQP
ncbi:MAG: zeta toxin family protein [Pseudomonadota bacterium]